MTDRTITLPTDIGGLRVRIAEGERFSFRFFYGHRQRPEGHLSDAVFSQFFPCSFEIDGQRYGWAEQWMMAEKARLFRDDHALERVMAATTPQAVKRAGRAVSPYENTFWSAVRFDRVVAGNLAKFGQDARLRQYLVETGPAILVEAAPTDAIWGIGLTRDDPAAADPKSWPGGNLLDFALVKVREILARS